MNEKFGDGIMSAISFSTKVEKETDETGANWAVITLRGKWWVELLLAPPLERCGLTVGSNANKLAGCHTQDFDHIEGHSPSHVNNPSSNNVHSFSDLVVKRVEIFYLRHCRP